MPFDPDKYLAKVSGASNGAQGASVPTAGFDPSAYLAKATGQQPAEATSPYQAGLESFGNATSLGYLPSMQAKAEPYTDQLFAAIEGKEAPEDNSTYVQRRDENIARQAEQSRQHPYASLGGLLAGSVVGGGLVGSAIPVAAGGNLARAAIGGGLLGVAQNPGDVRGELSGPQVKERLEGGAIGAAAGTIGEKLISAVQGAPAALKNLAQTKAAKSAGMMLGDYRKAFARGGTDRVNELGEEMLQSGLSAPGSTFQTVAEKSKQLKKEVGAQIGELYDRLASSASANRDSLINSFSIADPQTVRSELIAATRSPRVMPHIGAESYRNSMDGIINDIAKGPTHDARYLNDLIGELDGRINWSKQVPEMNDQMAGLVAIRNTLRQKVVDLADRLGAQDEALGMQLKMLNKRYGNLSDISRISQDQVGRQEANRFLSPSDYGSAAIGAMLGGSFGENPEQRIQHAVLGAGLGLANKGMRKYANPIIATGANKTAQALKPLANIKTNPAAVGAATAAGVNQFRK